MRIPSAEEMPGLTRKEREHIAHLQRRREFLLGRVDGSEQDLSWDKAEMSALDWAIDTLSNLITEDVA